MTKEADDTLALAAEFPAATHDDWLKLVAASLKGKAFEQLVGHTDDGLRIEPLAPRKADAQPLAARAPGAPWQIVQRIEHPDPATANAQAREDVENGATGLTLVFAGAIGAYGFGLPPEADALERVLDGIDLAGVAIDLDIGPHRDTAGQLAAYIRRRGLVPGQLRIRFGLDPIGAAALAGAAPQPWTALAPHFGAQLAQLAADGFTGALCVSDGRVIYNAGGSEAQELGFVLAVGIAYLRALESAGIPLDQARGMIAFRLAADADQFVTMAKFRALRKLWARAEAACGLAPKPAFLAAETAWRMLTQRDPHVNILRATIAATAAGLAGADAVTVLPFTAALGLPDAFARRVARNLQLVLLEESNLYRVGDPAAGSGGIEALTGELCRAAWNQFQDIEAAGGVMAALEQGLLQQEVARIRGERAAAVATRRRAITGTSNYPNLAETPVSVLDVPLVVSMPLSPAVATFEALPSMRLAEPFEALRDASDRILAATGARPKVFLANLGKPSEFTARAAFAKSFYEAGGIESIGNDGFSDHAAMAAAFKASGARIACLCSSDRVYAAEVEGAVAALKRAGTIIHLAGQPGERQSAWNKAGVNTYIFVGCDVLSILQAAHAVLCHGT